MFDGRHNIDDRWQMLPVPVSVSTFPAAGVDLRQLFAASTKECLLYLFSCH